MILEIAQIEILSQKNEEFEEAFNFAVKNILTKAKGFIFHEMNRCIENPEKYVLLIQWETLEDHTEGFRKSELFAQWREVIGKFFASPPVVYHYKNINLS